jgi:hypothetical protein
MMNPIRFRTRTELIEYVLEHAPLNAIRRAIDEGLVLVCGGFSKLPPHQSPGWVVEVTSKHGRTWPVAVKVNQFEHSYQVVVLDQTPWQHWDGKLDRGHPVYDGDFPEFFQHVKDRANV